MCLTQGHNTVSPVRIELRTSRFGVCCTTTMPPRSQPTDVYKSLDSTCNRLQHFLRHLIVCGNDTAKSNSDFSFTSSGRRFVEINLVETTLSRIRPSPGRYDIRSNSVLCAFQNPHVRMAWNTYMHVEC